MKSIKTIKKICEYCKKEFDAGKITVRYCSHQCNKKAHREDKRNEVIRMTETLTKKKKVNQINTALADRPYLSIAEAALLLGVCKQTVYNLALAKKIKATRVTRRLTFVTRKSIDELIGSNTHYEKLPTHKKYQPIEDWYTLNEITERYGILRHRIRKIINAENIDNRKDGTRTLVAKCQIDNYFKKKGFEPSVVNLAEWYSIAEIIQKYGMTEAAVYTFVSRYKIPKKQQGGQRYYSKYHIDKLKMK